jgi:hypothetical protein
LVTRLPRARTRAARRIAQLDVHYRGSPLTQRGEPRGRARPGDRAPDATGLLVDGVPTTLHRLLGDRHTALIVVGTSGPDPGEAVRGLARWSTVVVPLVVQLEGVPPSVSDARTAVDALGTVRRSYAAGVHLVRPDGYLAASGRGAAEAYLRTVYGPCATEESRPGVSRARGAWPPNA